MLDKFYAMGVAIRESFRGAANKSRITLQNLDSFVLPNPQESRENHLQNKIYPDEFDVRNDRTQVAFFVDKLYSLDSNFSGSVQKNIEGGLRDWAKRYSQGMRVIRYVDHENGKPEETIGFIAVFPVHEESEDVFYESPRNSFYLGTFSKGMQDPIQYAENDDNCYSACIRCWQIKPDRWTFDNALMLFNETQNVLREMHRVHPDLSDIYSIPIHPLLQKFALSLGFQTQHKGRHQDLHWLHISLDRFLAIDGETAISNFDFRDVSFN